MEDADCDRGERCVGSVPPFVTQAPAGHPATGPQPAATGAAREQSLEGSVRTLEVSEGVRAPAINRAVLTKPARVLMAHDNRGEPPPGRRRPEPAPSVAAPTVDGPVSA